MHGLPQDFDPSIFVNKTLNQISFTTNTVNFIFDENLSVTALESFSYSIKQTKEEIVSFPVKDSKIVKFLEKSVENATKKDRGTLSLYFQCDWRIRFFDNTPNYESYHIWDGKREIIV